jgi:hypothetical protein
MKSILHSAKAISVAFLIHSFNFSLQSATFDMKLSSPRRCEGPKIKHADPSNIYEQKDIVRTENFLAKGPTINAEIV